MKTADSRLRTRRESGDGGRNLLPRELAHDVRRSEGPYQAIRTPHSEARGCATEQALGANDRAAIGEIGDVSRRELPSRVSRPESSRFLRQNGDRGRGG